MQELGCSAWTIRQSTNMWGKPVPDQGKAPDTGLYLIYGALFAMVRRDEGADQKIRTLYGAVLDDVERTLRVFHRDGAIARYSRYAVAKLKKPGAFVANAGGVSALYSSPESHSEAKMYQLQRLQDEFPNLLRLKKGDALRDFSTMAAPFRFLRPREQGAESEVEE